MRKIFVLILGFSFLLLIGCTTQQPLDLAAEKSEVAAICDKHVEILKTEDMDMLAGIYCHDPEMINFGTEANERIVGWDGLKHVMQQQFEQTETTNVAVHDRVIKIHDSGQVAWFSEILDWEIVVGDETFKMDGLRATGVLEKKEGEWKIVQVHYSLPNSN